jgi:DNA-binding transcriptional LysR family regulator
VLTDRPALTAGRDYGVLSGRTWRLADLGAKQSMLLAGLGWGNMPAHLVETDVAQGRLKVIRPVEFDARIAQLGMRGAYLADHRLGPAGQWMIEHLADCIVRNSSAPSGVEERALTRTTRVNRRRSKRKPPSERKR